MKCRHPASCARAHLNNQTASDRCYRIRPCIMCPADAASRLRQSPGPQPTAHLTSIICPWCMPARLTPHTTITIRTVAHARHTYPLAHAP